MPYYIIERNYAEQVQHSPDGAAALKLINDEEEVRWLYSFLSIDRRKSYCVYEAPSPEAIMAAAALLTQNWLAGAGYDLRVQQTSIFTLLCFVQLGNALSVRSVHRPVISRGIFSNLPMWGAVWLTVAMQMAIVYAPFLHPIFKTTSLDWTIMRIVLMVTVLCLVLIESLKFFRQRFYSHA